MNQCFTYYLPITIIFPPAWQLVFSCISEGWDLVREQTQSIAITCRSIFIQRNTKQSNATRFLNRMNKITSTAAGEYCITGLVKYSSFYNQLCCFIKLFWEPKKDVFEGTLLLFEFFFKYEYSYNMQWASEVLAFFLKRKFVWVKM